MRSGNSIGCVYLAKKFGPLSDGQNGPWRLTRVCVTALCYAPLAMSRPRRTEGQTTTANSRIAHENFSSRSGKRTCDHSNRARALADGSAFRLRALE